MKKVGEKHGVVAYLRCSTEEQGVSGAGLAAQEAAIRAECDRRELPLLAMHTDAGVSGKSLVRPALTAALADLDAGHGDVLMVSKFDRLTRSVHDVSGLMQRSEKAGWGLVALDAPVDTTSPSGRAIAQILSVFAELERRLIGERTGKPPWPSNETRVLCSGRPRTLPDKVVRRIVNERAVGRTWTAIAEGMNADPGSHSPGRVALVSGHGPVRGEFREATRLRPGVQDSTWAKSPTTSSPTGKGTSPSRPSASSSLTSPTSHVLHLEFGKCGVEGTPWTTPSKRCTLRRRSSPMTSSWLS